MLIINQNKNCKIITQEKYMKQYNNWQKEYTDIKGIPTTTRDSVSSAITSLIEFCNTNKLDMGKKVVDLGSGIGRNTIYLAQQGFNVTAIDFIQEALDQLSEKVNNLNLSKNIKIVKGNIAEVLPFRDNAFDSAIDIVSSISLNLSEMAIFESEVRRIVKPNGLFLTYIHSRDDEYLAERSDKQGFYKVPESGLIEHSWKKDELEDLYYRWNIVKLKKREKEDDFYGKKYIRRIWWLLLQNIKNSN